MTSSKETRTGSMVLPKVSIQAIPKHGAIAASDHANKFQVVVRLKAPSMPRNSHPLQRAPIDLVMVIEASETFSAWHFYYIKSAIRFVIQNLAPSDRLSIVSFCSYARRVLPLSAMTASGKYEAFMASEELVPTEPWINVVEGLTEAVEVLEEREYKNPVACILLLCGGEYNFYTNVLPSLLADESCDPSYLQLLPASIYPENQKTEDGDKHCRFPVFSFGLGLYHDPVGMHAISHASGGTYSFVQLIECTQDAVAACMGGLLSVVSLDLHLKLVAPSNGVIIKSVDGGQFFGDRVQCELNIDNLHADEEKEYLVRLSVPQLSTGSDDRKTSLIRIVCSYRGPFSPRQIDHYKLDIQRPDYVEASLPSMAVARQILRLNAAEAIQTAHMMAERDEIADGQILLMMMIHEHVSSPSVQVGDPLCLWTLAESLETARRMGSYHIYEWEGRAYALSNMSSQASQRATTRACKVPGALIPFIATNAHFEAYVTRNIYDTVKQSRGMSRLFWAISSILNQRFASS